MSSRGLVRNQNGWSFDEEDVQLRPRSPNIIVSQPYFENGEGNFPQIKHFFT
jgi:hypothetical protein